MNHLTVKSLTDYLNSSDIYLAVYVANHFKTTVPNVIQFVQRHPESFTYKNFMGGTNIKNV